MKAPSLTRERRNGRPVGPWLAELDGEIVDLHTKVKATAIGRAAKLAGKKNGKNGAAALTSQAFAVAESAPPAADSPTVAAGGAPAGGVIENSATPDPGPRLLEAIHPDAVFPPPPPETGDWTADAARAAAGDTGGAAPTPAGTTVEASWLDGVITQLAQGAVELQLMLQAWLLARFGRIAAGDVPPPVLRPGVELWEAQIRIWMPSDVPLPPFVVAIVLTGLASIPIQAMTGQPIPKAAPKTSPPTKAPVDGTA